MPNIARQMDVCNVGSSPMACIYHCLLVEFPNRQAPLASTCLASRDLSSPAYFDFLFPWFTTCLLGPAGMLQVNRRERLIDRLVMRHCICALVLSLQRPPDATSV